MGRGRRFRASLTAGDIRASLLLGLVYFCLAATTIRLASQSGGAAILWSANGVMLAALLLRPRRRWWPILAATFLGCVAATSVVSGPSFVPLLFGVANVAEVLVAALLARFSRSDDGLGGNPRSMMRFVFACAAGPAVSGVLGAGIFWMFRGEHFWDSFLIWFAADALGLLIFTPFFFALFAGLYRRGWRESSPMQRWEAGALLVLTAIISLGVFMAERPLLFFLVMPTMLVSFRTGWLGAKIAAMVIAVTGAICTAAGHGPIVILTHDPVVRAHFLQMFIAAQLLTQWPVVAALGTRDRLVQQLAESERSLRFLAAQSCVLMLTFDVGGICRKAVGDARLLPGCAEEGLPGMRVEDLSTDAASALRAAHEAALDFGEIVHSVEFRVGEGAWLEATFRVLEDENGRCPGTLMTLHDISVRKQESIALARVAETDSLTGLLNRAGFLARLEQAVTDAPEGSLSLAMIDVDRFKLVNDNCGHQTGDMVLAEVARRIAGLIRSTDSVGRLGGDEFVVLLGTGDWNDAKEICARLVQAVGAEPVRIRTGHSIGTEISCGLVQYRAGQSASQFLNDADVALYEAKRAGRNQMVAA